MSLQGVTLLAAGLPEGQTLADRAGWSPGEIRSLSKSIELMTSTTHPQVQTQAGLAQMYARTQYLVGGQVAQAPAP